MIRLELSIAGALLLLCAASPATADEPVGAREPHLMSETAEVTSVVDAFDGDDPFDLNLVLGFTQSWEHAKIRRETQLNQVGLADGGFIPGTENIASYSASRSTLLVGADVGLYKDLALIFRVPLTLSWSQSLGDLNGSQAVAPMLLADPLSPGGKTPIFNVPFTSPTRSGVDYISAGIDWAIYNQQRDETKPTWVIGIEGRLAVGPALHACNANATPECPDPSDYTNAAKSRQPGISKAYDTVIGRTVWSRRFGYVEPYTGFSVEAQFPQSRGDFGAYNAPNDLERMPPLLGSFMLGLEVVPYEHREQYQRLSADFRFKGTYQSPGRDYSELFDALGSTMAPSLRIPNPAAYTNQGGMSLADKNSESVYFTGITEQQAYGSFALSASTTWQAGQYIKFTAGGAFTYAQPHLVTAADTCTPNNTNPQVAGPCAVTNGAMGTTVLGTPNPDHHDLIDLPGHRFSIDDTTIVDLWIMGTVMF